MHCRSTDSSSHPGNLCLAYLKPCLLEGSFEHFCSFNELHWRIVLWSRGSTRAEILSKLLHPRACFNCSLPVFVIFVFFCCCFGVSIAKWSDNKIILLSEGQMQLKCISSSMQRVCGQHCSAMEPAGSWQLGQGLGSSCLRIVHMDCKTIVCILVFVVCILTNPFPCVTGA